MQLQDSMILSRRAVALEGLGLPYLGLVSGLALVYTLACNLPYARLLFAENTPEYYFTLLLSLVYSLTLLHTVLYFRWIGRLVLPLLFVTSAVILYFSLAYGYVQNREMFNLLFNTNIPEIRGVFSPKVLLYAGFGLFAAVAALLLRKKMERPSPLWFLGVLAVLLGVWFGLRAVSPRAIKGKEPMPLSYLTHFSLAVKQHLLMDRMMEERVPLPGTVEYTPGKEPLYLVVALGESLRADHLAWYGYSRNTDPYTRPNIPLLPFRTVYSAGTGTLESVTRILTRATIRDTKPALEEQSFISLFHRAGFRTVWLTNQGSMAGAETPIASLAREADIYRTHPNVYRVKGTLMDSDLLPMLDEVLALPPKNTLIILHSYGSHLHPEDRYADLYRVFTPVCTSLSAADCGEKELINSYDNSVVATDAFGAALAERLRDKNALLVITSDHGSRLRGPYKGSDSRAQDVPVLRDVPLMLYASPSLTSDKAALSAQARQSLDIPVSHDVLFHSLLGFASIRTPVYQPGLDIFSGALEPYAAPFTTLPPPAE